jgi:hypothetical protein
MAGQAHTEPRDKKFRQDLQDAQDWMQGSLETALRGDPKAVPWEQWEAQEHKNKLAHSCAHGFPFFQAIQPCQLFEYQSNLRNLWIKIRVQEIFQQEPYASEAEPFKPSALWTFQIAEILLILSN